MASDLIDRVTLSRYSRGDLAELLDVSKTSVSRWIAAERIAYDQARGQRLFFSQAAVLKFLREDYLAVPKRPKADA